MVSRGWSGTLFIFRFYSQFLQTNNLLGGVNFLRNQLIFSYIPYTWACFVCQGHFPSLNVTIAIVYHRPDSNIDTYTELFAYFLIFLTRCRSQHVSIFGDLNIDIRDSDSKILYFLNVQKSHKYYPYNLKSTRLHACVIVFIINQLCFMC